MAENEKSAQSREVQMPWRRASPADVENFDFEQPISDLNAADCLTLSERFRGIVQSTGGADDILETRDVRVFSMLWALTGMYQKSKEPNEPFGPMFSLADGRRSAIPTDFPGAALDVISYMAERATNPVLRARLSDVCWLVDRKRARLGTLAISSYVEVVQLVDQKRLLFTHHPAEADQAISHSSCDLLRRAVQIAWLIGWDKPDGAVARNLISELRKRAGNSGELGAALWFSELDLDYQISDPASVALALEDLVKDSIDKIDVHLHIGLWRQAARAYHIAKMAADRDRCREETAERLVAEAERYKGSALLTAHWLSAAIVELHGLPDKRAERTSLRHRLVDAQAGASEEMITFTHPIDTKFTEGVRDRMTGLGLRDKLFFFACLARSPDPSELRKAALRAIAEHPLQFAFGTAHLDSEGKVVHRTEGGLNNEGAVEQQIAHAERIRRELVAATIETCRNGIIDAYYISEDILGSLLFNSPFIPNDLLQTFSRGFCRFFQGDFTSAIYILTPLLENSLRHVLKGHGHEVTKFDDADLTQEDRTISSLFLEMRAELESIFTNPVVADIEHVFLKRPGPALRHQLAHGLLHDNSVFAADALYGCWLMFRLCCLPLLPYVADIELLGER